MFFSARNISFVIRIWGAHNGREDIISGLRLEMAKTKYSEQFAEIEMTEDEKKQLYAFDYSSLSALRDIKRVFNNRLMDYFTEKGVLR